MSGPLLFTEMWVRVVRREGWTLQDENQPGPEGMVLIGGFADRTGGYRVWCAVAKAKGARARIKAVMEGEDWL